MKNKILIIEDSVTLRRPLVSALTFEGYEVLEACDGDEGLDRIASEKPDVVICDIMMPNKDGYEVLKAIRTNDATIDIPFIFLSAKTDKIDIRKGMQLTADDYIPKPASIKDVLASIKAQIARSELKRKALDTKFKDIKDDITNKLPHELMTPLSCILGLSEFMSHEKDLDAASVRELSEDIHTSGMRLMRMIKNYLLYTKLSLLARQPKPTVEPYDIQPINLAENLKIWAEESATLWGRKKDLSLQISSAELTFYAIGLENIIHQLLDNAFKCSQPGSSVKLTATVKADRLNISVSDHGRGMRESMIQEIEPFNQFERQEHEQQGSGLGLAIVKLIVQLHNGTFNLSSTYQRCTQVDIQLCTHPRDWAFKVSRETT